MLTLLIIHGWMVVLTISFIIIRSRILIEENTQTSIVPSPMPVVPSEQKPMSYAMDEEEKIELAF